MFRDLSITEIYDMPEYFLYAFETEKYYELNDYEQYNTIIYMKLLFIKYKYYV